MNSETYASAFAQRAEALVTNISPGTPLNRAAREAKRALEILLREYKAEADAEAKRKAFETFPDDFEVN